MWRRSIICWLLCLPVCACSDGPTAPETKQLTRDDLMGSWSGQLDEINFVPDYTIPNWDDFRDKRLYSNRYYFTDLNVIVVVMESSFLLHLTYHSDSLEFTYYERGSWGLTGNSPWWLSMDSVNVSGNLETLYGGVAWMKSECCWQARLALEPGDFSRSFFSGGILKITNIQNGLRIPDLVVKKQDVF